MVGSIFAFSHKVGLQVVCYKIQVPWLGEKISSPPEVTLLHRDDLFRTQILHKSLDNIFYMIQSTYFSPVFWNSLRFKRGLNFRGWGGKPILQNNWIASIERASFLGSGVLFPPNIWSPLLQFNFKSFIDSNSFSFIRFQCILHGSGKLFSESWNFYK